MHQYYSPFYSLRSLLWSSICQEIAASFSAGGARGYEYGPAFVPAEICRIFRSAGEKFLHLVCMLNPDL